LVPKAKRGEMLGGTPINVSKQYIITGTIMKQAPTPKKELTSPTKEPANIMITIMDSNVIIA